MRWHLTWHFLRSQWRERLILTFSLAVLIGVGTLAIVDFFSDIIQQKMNEEASVFLGADWLVESTIPLPIEKWSKRAGELNLKSTQTIEFLSVVGGNGHFQLASIKAVDLEFPLSGQLKMQTGLAEPEQVVHTIPEPGEIWIAPRLLPAFNMNMGDALDISSQAFKITGLLTYEPDAGLALLMVGPRILMNINDVLNSPLIGFGSQVKYRFLISGPRAAVQQFEKEIKPTLTPQQEILDSMTVHPEMVRPIENLLKFLTLTALIIFLLTALSISLATRTYVEKQTDNIAMMRCLGATKGDIRAMTLSGLLVLAIILSLGAYILAYGICRVFMHFAMHAWQLAFAPPPVLQPLVLSVLTGIVLVICFTWPWLINLQHVSPIRILQRHQLEIAPTSYIVYAGMVVILCVLWSFYQSPLLIIWVWAVIILAMGCYALFASLLLRWASFASKHITLSWRLGLIQTMHTKRGSLIHMVVFAFALTVVFAFTLMRQDFLDAWENKFPSDSPNYFMINVLPDQLDKLAYFFTSSYHQEPVFYPMVRARLTAVNNEPITLSELPKDAPQELKRDFNISFADILNSEAVIEGQAWDQDSYNKSLISLEGNMAKSLHAHVGDKLTFLSGQTAFEVTVKSVRAVDWYTIEPNFYAITTPSVLASLPTTYLASFYLNKKDEHFINSLAAHFPNLTFVNVNDIINNLKDLLRQAFLVVEALFFLICVALALMLWVIARTQAEALAFTSTVLRTLGATRSQLLQSFLSEFALIGFIAGIVAVIPAQILSNIFVKHVLMVPHHIHWHLLILAPLAGLFIYTGLGYFMVRRLMRSVPIVKLAWDSP